MELKIFGREEGGLAYVLRDRTARLISGDSDLTQALIGTIQGRQRFTAGVLSEIKVLDPKVRMAAIRGAEYQFRAGLPPESLSIVWVGHSGKDRDESHFIGANLELVTGRPYSLYIDRIDRHRIQAFQEHFNLIHDLPNPSSRLRVHPDYSKSRQPMEHQKLLMNVWNLIHDKVESGLVTSRSELIAALRSDGYNIRSETYAGRPLEQPVLTLPDGALLRLKGSIYYRRDFTPDMLVPKQEQAKPEIINARIKELRRIVAAGLEFRAHHTIGHLFGCAEQRCVKRGAARDHLAHLLRIKLSDWEVAEPIHPMFGPTGIARLNMLIELKNQGVDLFQIPVPESPTISGPAHGQGNSGPQNRAVPTAEKKPPARGQGQPFWDPNDHHIPIGIRTAPVISATPRSEEKTSASETSTLAMPPAANSDPTPSKRRCKKQPKKTELKDPETIGDLG